MNNLRNYVLMFFEKGVTVVFRGNFEGVFDGNLQTFLPCFFYTRRFLRNFLLNQMVLAPYISFWIKMG